jgi:hypothetical protein
MGKKGGKCSNLKTTWSRGLRLGFGALHCCIPIWLYAFAKWFEERKVKACIHAYGI